MMTIAVPLVFPVSLAGLVSDPDGDVLCEIARNPATPVVLLRALANLPHPRVRICVAGNDHTPSDVLGILATLRNNSLAARRALAFNPNTPTEVRSGLNDDSYNSGDITDDANTSETPEEAVYALIHEVEAITHSHIHTWDDVEHVSCHR
jgi:hypothetical protein